MGECDRVDPALQRVLEAVAAAMSLDHGEQRLELIFDDGRLRTWFSHQEKRRPGELARFDADAMADPLLRQAVS